jgi:hypothetical protein
MAGDVTRARLGAWRNKGVGEQALAVCGGSIESVTAKRMLSGDGRVFEIAA